MVKKITALGLKNRLSFLFLILLLSTSCINVTEHEMGYKAGLHVISANDFSILTVVPDIPGARSLLIYPNIIFVVSTEGKIFRYDSETMELIEENQIASASAAGFSEIVFCSRNNSAYLIGAFGKILEVSLPDCIVTDEFSVCQSPVKLALAPGSRNLFVGDGTTSKVFQVLTSNNTVYGSTDLFFNMFFMEALPVQPLQNSDSVLVSTTDALSMVEVLGVGDLRSILLTKYTSGAFLDFVSVPNDSFFVAIHHDIDHDNFSVGSYRLTIPFVLPPEPPAYNYFGREGIAGNTHLLTMGRDYQHAYILSYLGDNVSRLSAYSYISQEITKELDFPGYPVDLQASGSGNIYVLTALQ